MTIRQKLLKLFYPLLMAISGLAAKKSIAIRKDPPAPPADFYGMSVETGAGKIINLSVYKGKKLMLVNTASDCGYTGQLESLEKLYRDGNGKFEILAFPSNDFKEQEKGDDASIARFCQVNYGVSFTIIKKSVVVKSAGQHAVFQWLTEAAHNGWNNRSPVWNFTKYIINEEGRLIAMIGPQIDPLNKNVRELMNM